MSPGGTSKVHHKGTKNTKKKTKEKAEGSLFLVAFVPLW
jgi:hypothetical protein